MEQVIKSRIPGLQSLINKTIIELETELSRLGKPVATDAGVRIALWLFFIILFSIGLMYEGEARNIFIEVAHLIARIFESFHLCIEYIV